MVAPHDPGSDGRVTDPARLAALEAAGLLDTPPEESFDRLTRLAAGILNAPIALVSLVDARRQFFKSATGLTGPLAESRGTPLDQSFCRQVVASAAPLVIADATADPVWRDHPGTKSGAVAYLGVPLTTRDGHPLGSFCAVDTRPRDWSDRELAVVRELAALAVSEIELRLLARQLHQEHLELRALQLLRDDTAQMLVHDLRNPLTSVLGGLELLLATQPLTDRQRQYAGLAAQGAESLVNLVTAVLDTQKADVGKLGLHLRPCPPAELAGAAARQVGGAAAARRVGLVLDLPADLPAVAADADKVCRVFVNLLGNAVQHTAAGGTVRVTAEADGQVVTFTVADTGRGLPPEAFARLFQRFGTADAAERGRASTGLGLAFSRAVVEAHGGRIWADSVLGQGTAFRFTLRSAEPVAA